MNFLADLRTLTLVALLALATVIEEARKRDCPFARARVGPELEKRLGRPPTEEEWRFYWQEVQARQRAQGLRTSYKGLSRNEGREAIRRFVWGEGESE